MNPYQTEEITQKHENISQGRAVNWILPFSLKRFQLEMIMNEHYKIHMKQ